MRVCLRRSSSEAASAVDDSRGLVCAYFVRVVSAEWRTDAGCASAKDRGYSMISGYP